MGYAVSGFCYPDIQSAAVRIGSDTTIAGAVVQGPPGLGTDAQGWFVSLPVSAIQNGNLTALPQLIFRPIECAIPGALDYLPFDPASLDAGILVQAFSAGFVSVSIPVVLAIGISAVLDLIRGNKP